MYLNLRAPPQKAAKKRILLQVLVPKLQALVKNANKYHNIHLKTVKWPKLSLIMPLYQKTESCNLYNVGCYDLQQIKRRIMMGKRNFLFHKLRFSNLLAFMVFFTIPVFFLKLFEVSHHLTCLVYICSSVNKTLQDCFFLNFFYFSTPGVMQMLSSSSQTTYGDQKTITDYLWAGLSLRARGRGFPWILREWPPDTFVEKQKKNRTKRNP